jgi:Ca2+-binding RTX toxin-like protein
MIDGRSTKVIRRRAALLIVCALVMSIPGVARAAPPTNDDFADAAEVTGPLPFADSVDTTEATDQPGEPSAGNFGCGFTSATVWYSFTPSVDTIVGADTVGSDFDTTLAVWTGSDLGSLSLVGCSDDARGGFQSTVPFAAEAGVQYQIQVGGFAGQTGVLEFHVRTTVAGFVEGTVTDHDPATPLRGICVILVDAVFGNNAVIGITGADGTFRIAARPGNYLALFVDCVRDRYIPQYWDGAPSDATADEIVVSENIGMPGIDADLVRGCPGFGSSGLNQVVGTSSADLLEGTPRRDVICGLGGDDVLRGFKGADLLSGGQGADELHGSDGSDSLRGKAGGDRLFGGVGRDDLRGGLGRDRCDGGPDRDFGRSCEVKVRIERSSPRPSVRDGRP